MKYSHFPLIFGTALLAVTSATAPAAGEDAQPVYPAVIEKIINTYCMTCHTPEKKKGKLIMETYETLMKGGSSVKDGHQTVAPGKSADSLMYSQLVLPKDDDLHMPPPDKPQPTSKEIEVIKWWIDAGAKKEVAIKDAGVPAGLKDTVLELASKKVERPPPAK
jgi:Planctomycete cytochrome C